jgi:hypothetical protein
VFGRPWTAPRLWGVVAVAVPMVTSCASGDPTTSADPQAYDGHRWRVTQLEQVTPMHRTIRVAPADQTWISFDGHGHLTAHDVVEQRFTLRYAPTAEGFHSSRHDPASVGWYASRLDEDIDIGLCAVIGTGQVHVIQTGNDSLRLTSEAPAHSQRWGTYILRVVRD